MVKKCLSTQFGVGLQVIADWKKAEHGGLRLLVS